MRRLALAALALSLAACASDPAEAPAPEPAAEPDAVLAEPAAEPTDAPADAPAAYRIVSAASGDRACYLDLDPEAGGETESFYADFEVCYEIETDGLTGRLVTLTTEPGTIMAESCEGDIECTDTETVDLVMAIERVD